MLLPIAVDRGHGTGAGNARLGTAEKGTVGPDDAWCAAAENRQIPRANNPQPAGAGAVPAAQPGEEPSGVDTLHRESHLRRFRQ